ncbi:DUF1810 domain-containing protein [Olivibacter sp. XZL3]|uniref:DUF1810 domain-containing protein n=1 Tax=Olivibacter sp. XZL3 TaxID=1735116 RepID=UPI001064AA3B|nr:DUF1810 domain-containing protein [Olivibacter sp. XZL3]
MKQDKLERFLKAQQNDFPTALQEIRNGKKRSHWMWYVFPQIQGLGFSDMARFYAIRDRQEAIDYLAHPVLGKRLLLISGELLKLETDDPTEVMGTPDDLKLKSSMTLFAALSETDPVFQDVLDRFYRGAQDTNTLRLINAI